MKTKKKVKAKGKGKTILTPRFQPSHQKSKGKPKKVTAILAKQEWYKVELEVASKAGDGTMQYTFADHTSGVTEEQARESADGLKAIGCGGRIIHLDGTPDGKVILTWGSVDRTAAAEKVERASLEKTTGHN